MPGIGYIRLQQYNTEGQPVSSYFQLNNSFWISDFSHQFRVASTPIPRGHGDVVPSKLYMAGRTFAIQGALWTDEEAGMSAEAFWAQIEAFWAGTFYGGKVAVILPTGYTIFAYPNTIKSTMEAGGADTRYVQMSFHAADPLCYQTFAQPWTVNDNGPTVDLSGDWPSYHWGLSFQAPSGVSTVRVLYSTTGDYLELTGINQTDVITIDAYRRLLLRYNPTLYGNTYQHLDWTLYSKGIFFPLTSATAQQLYFANALGTSYDPSTFQNVSGAARGATRAFEAVPLAAWTGLGIYGQSVFGNAYPAGQFV